MTPESFCHWLTGYLSSVPDTGHHHALRRINDTLDGVVYSVMPARKRDSEFFSTAPHNED